MSTLNTYFVLPFPINSVPLHTGFLVKHIFLCSPPVVITRGVFLCVCKRNPHPSRAGITKNLTFYPNSNHEKLHYETFTRLYQFYCALAILNKPR